MRARLEQVGLEQPTAGTAIASFRGEHDVATRDAVSELLRSLLEQNELVVADFSAARFVDGAILGALLDTDREAKSQGRTFRLQLATAPIVQRAFDISGVSEMIECAGSREEALGLKDDS